VQADRQAQIDARKEKYIVEIFVDTADEDYVVARLLYLTGLERQFFWSAAQAVEKYLKAALLLNGEPVKHYKHRLTAMFDRLSAIAGPHLATDLEMPPQLKRFGTHERYLKGGTLRAFVQHIEKHGRPANRYDTIGTDSEFGDINRLDRAIFILRRLTVDLSARVEESKGETFKDWLPLHPQSLVRDFRHRLIHTPGPSYSVHQAARENNYAFAPKFEHTDVPLRSGHHVSSLEILFKMDIDYAHELRQWVLESIDLSPADLARLRAKRRARK
jgi:HEPN domain-containing protein